MRSEHAASEVMDSHHYYHVTDGKACFIYGKQELKCLQDHPFMRHLQSHADSIWFLQTETFQGVNCNPALAANSPSQPLQCAVKCLAERGAGQVIITFWPADPLLQQAAAAEQHRRTGGIPSCPAASPGAPDPSLADILQQLGHEVILNQGLVDVSMLPMGSQPSVHHRTTLPRSAQQPGLLQRLIAKVTQKAAAPSNAVRSNTSPAVSTSMVPNPLNTTCGTYNAALGVPPTSTICDSQGGMPRHQQQEQYSYYCNVSDNPCQLRGSDLALVQQWLRWDELHNIRVPVSPLNSHNSDNGSGCSDSIVPGVGCVTDGALVSNISSSMVPGSPSPLAVEALTAATAAAEVASSEADTANTESYWGSRGPTAEDVVPADSMPAAACDSLALSAQAPGEVDLGVATCASVSGNSSAVPYSGQLPAQQGSCRPTLVASGTEPNPVHALMSKHTGWAKSRSSSCSSLPSTIRGASAASNPSSTYTAPVGVCGSPKRMSSVLEDPAAESAASTSLARFPLSLMSHAASSAPAAAAAHTRCPGAVVHDSCEGRRGTARSDLGPPSLPSRCRPPNGQSAGTAVDYAHEAASDGMSASSGPTVEEVFASLSALPATTIFCLLASEQTSPAADSDEPKYAALIRQVIRSRLQWQLHRLEQGTAAAIRQTPAPIRSFGTEDLKLKKATAEADAAVLVAPVCVAVSKAPGLTPALAPPEAKLQQALTAARQSVQQQVQNQVEQCYRHMIDTSKCEESPTGSFSSDICRYSSPSPLLSSLRGAGTSSVGGSVVYKGGLDSFSCSNISRSPSPMLSSLKGAGTSSIGGSVVYKSSLDSFSCRNSSVGDWQASASPPGRHLFNSSPALCRATSPSTLSRLSSQQQRRGSAHSVLQGGSQAKQLWAPSRGWMSAAMLQRGAPEPGHLHSEAADLSCSHSAQARVASSSRSPVGQQLQHFRVAPKEQPVPAAADYQCASAAPTGTGMTATQQKAPSTSSSPGCLAAAAASTTTAVHDRYACPSEPWPQHATSGTAGRPPLTRTVSPLWYDLDYASWDPVRFEDIHGHWDWVQEEDMWQQIRNALQCVSAATPNVAELQQQYHGKPQLLSLLMLQLQPLQERQQQRLQELLDKQRDRRVEQHRLTRQQQLQEQLQEDLIIGTQGLKYPSLFGTDEVTYPELQELIRQEFAARFMGDGATLAALHVPKYWVLSDAAVGELVQWIWEECLDRMLQEQQLQEAGESEPPPQQLRAQDPLRGMLRMHHNISKGLAGVVAAHARSAAQQSVEKFLSDVAQQQQADAAMLEQLQQEIAEGEIDAAASAEQEYQFGVEWRYQLYQQRRQFKQYQEQQTALIPGLQQQSLEHDLALYAATKGGTQAAVQECQRGRLLAKHASSMSKRHWQEYNSQKSESGNFFNRIRWWFERAARTKGFKKFLRQHKDGISAQEKLRQKMEAVMRQQTHLVAGQHAEYGLP